VFDSNLILSGIYSPQSDEEGRRVISRDSGLLGVPVAVESEMGIVSPAVVDDFLAGYIEYQDQNNTLDYAMLLLTGLARIKIVKDLPASGTIDDFNNPCTISADSITIRSNFVDGWLGAQDQEKEKYYQQFSQWLLYRQYAHAYDLAERKAQILPLFPIQTEPGSVWFYSRLRIIDLNFESWTRKFEDRVKALWKAVSVQNPDGLVINSEDYLSIFWRDGRSSGPQHGYLDPNALLIGYLLAGRPDLTTLSDFALYVRLAGDDGFANMPFENELVRALNPADGHYDDVHSGGYDARYLIKTMLTFDLGMTALNITPHTSPDFKSFFSWFELNVVGVDSLDNFSLEKFNILLNIYNSVKQYQFRIQNDPSNPDSLSVLTIPNDSLITKFLKHYSWVESFQTSMLGQLKLILPDESIPDDLALGADFPAIFSHEFWPEVFSPMQLALATLTRYHKTINEDNFYWIGQPEDESFKRINSLYADRRLDIYSPPLHGRSDQAITRSIWLSLGSYDERVGGSFVTEFLFPFVSGSVLNHPEIPYFKVVLPDSYSSTSAQIKYYIKNPESGHTMTVIIDFNVRACAPYELNTGAGIIIFSMPIIYEINGVTISPEFVP
ncbi:MAG: hypothetical protein PHQ54_05085, partial [Candidatus Omnitrophica bacterium]|nr:hypothetical protein [Candidatus Omnitrophota bacterium]